MTDEPRDEGTATSPEDASALLDTLEARDLVDHPSVFEAVHRVLRDQLSGPAADRA